MNERKITSHLVSDGVRLPSMCTSPSGCSTDWLTRIIASVVVGPVGWLLDSLYDWLFCVQSAQRGVLIAPSPSGHISFPVLVGAPSLSCSEHIAMGCSPMPGCADWLAPTEIAYNWPIISWMPHPHPALEQIWTVDIHRQEGEARFVIYFGPVSSTSYV